MKIIALIPVRNESWILETCLSSIRDFCDEIIILDDASIDSSIEIARKFKCIIKEAPKRLGIINMAERRNMLLEEGRKRGGTHFVFIDADEALYFNPRKNFRNTLRALKPGEKISLRWITLWKDINKYRNDGPIFLNSYKDIIFCDDHASDFGNKFISEPRTPLSGGRVVKLEEDFGVLLHYQFVDWQRVQIKQAWYRCLEFLKKERNAKRINASYGFTKGEGVVKLTSAPKNWLEGFVQPKIIKNNPSFHLEEILAWFDEHGVEYFEDLDIWGIRELREKFIQKIGREPVAKTFPRVLIFLNNIRNNIINKALNKKA